MPHIKPLFRSLPSSTPTINYHDWLLGRPELKSWSDFTLHIDAVTGEQIQQRQARAVLERFEHAATALATSPKDGGLGLVSGRREVVGILSENCLVRTKVLSAVHLRYLPTMAPRKGIPSSRVCPSQVSRANGVSPFAVHSSRDRGTFEVFWHHMLIRERAVVPSRRRRRRQSDRSFRRGNFYSLGRRVRQSESSEPNRRCQGPWSLEDSHPNGAG